MKITLRQSQVFDAVASHGSVMAAAEQLNMSQSAASAALKEFQNALSRPPLFYRAGRKLVLTSEGKRLHPLVHSLLQAARQIEEPSALTDPEGDVLLGTTELGAHFLPAVVSAFRQDYPNIRVNIQVSDPLTIVGKLSNFTLDLVVTDNMTREVNAHMTELFFERTVIIAPPGHPMAGVDGIKPEQLADAPWCMSERRTLTSTRLFNIIRGHIANPIIAIEINSDEGIRKAVQSGIGISALPYSMVKEDLADGKLSEIKLAGAPFERPTYLMRMRNITASAPAELFARHLIASFART